MRRSQFVVFFKEAPSGHAMRYTPQSTTFDKIFLTDDARIYGKKACMYPSWEKEESERKKAWGKWSEGESEWVR